MPSSVQAFALAKVGLGLAALEVRQLGGWVCAWTSQCTGAQQCLYVCHLGINRTRNSIKQSAWQCGSQWQMQRRQSSPTNGELLPCAACCPVRRQGNSVCGSCCCTSVMKLLLTCITHASAASHQQDTPPGMCVVCMCRYAGFAALKPLLQQELTYTDSIMVLAGPQASRLHEDLYDRYHTSILWSGRSRHPATCGNSCSFSRHMRWPLP